MELYVRLGEIVNIGNDYDYDIKVRFKCDYEEWYTLDSGCSLKLDWRKCTIHNQLESWIEWDNRILCNIYKTKSLIR